MRDVLKRNGFFIQSDGLDGMGKGVIIEAIVTDLENKGLRILDLNQWWKKERNHPEFMQTSLSNYIPLESFDVIVSSEPTYAGVGLAIREEMIAKNGRNYSAHATAQAYALDRLILYNQIILPALDAGKIIIQSRGVSTSIVYQSLQKTMNDEKPLNIDEIIQIEGNRLALNNPPDLLIIPTIKDVKEVMKRLEFREKDDNCQFENLEFQLKIKPFYESEQLKEIFEKRGTKVAYLDVGKSIEYTKSQAVKIYVDAFNQKSNKLNI